MKPLQNLTIIIRSSGERTEALCRERVLAQGVTEEQVHVIHEVPFSKAMQASYSIGLAQGRKWTLCLDADVILRDGAILQVLELANKEADDLFGLSGRLLDKLFGSERPVGNHLFRTSLLSLMLQQIADYTEEDIRPETHVKDKMRALGYRWEKKHCLIGLHDFEQHPHDIARKAFVHVHKHTEELSELIGFWKEKRKQDSDFEIALFGASQSLLTEEYVRIDSRFFKDLQQAIHGRFSEKPAITEFSAEKVEKILTKAEYRYEPSTDLKIKRDREFRRTMSSKSLPQLIGLLLKNIKLLT